MFGARKARNIACTVQESLSSIVFVRIDKPVWQFEVLGKIKPALGWTQMVIDLSGVKRMTTAALAQLLAIKQQLSTTGRKMRIQGLQQQPRELCNLLKLTPMLSEDPEEKPLETGKEPYGHWLKCG